MRLTFWVGGGGGGGGGINHYKNVGGGEINIKNYIFAIIFVMQPLPYLFITFALMPCGTSPSGYYSNLRYENFNDSN